MLSYSVCTLIVMLWYAAGLGPNKFNWFICWVPTGHAYGAPEHCALTVCPIMPTGPHSMPSMLIYAEGPHSRPRVSTVPALAWGYSVKAHTQAKMWACYRPTTGRTVGRTHSANSLGWPAGGPQCGVHMCSIIHMGNGAHRLQWPHMGLERTCLLGTVLFNMIIY